MLLLAAACGATLAQTIFDEAELRNELARMYAALDSAFEQGRPDDALRIALPDATVRYGMEGTGALRTWLSEPHGFYAAGAEWNDAMPEANTLVVSMSKAFEGLIYFRRGHAVTVR